MKKIYKKIITFLLIFCIGVLIVPPTNIQAVSKIKGTESAENDGAFDSVGTQNMYKIWSVLKSFGLTDEQACGILGCFAHESGGDTYACQVIETHFFSEFGGYNEDSIEEYIETYSDPFIKDHDKLSVDALMKGYSVSSALISQARTGANTSGGNAGGKSLSIDTYFLTDDECRIVDEKTRDGNSFWMGIGLCGFTGIRAYSLVYFGIDNNAPWYIMENQLTWMFTPPEDGGDTSQPTLVEYKESTQGKSVEECTNDFCLSYVNGAMPDDWLTARKQTARELYQELKGKKWDAKYGKMILDGAGLKAGKVNNGIYDVSVYHDNASKVLIYDQNSGYLLDSTKEADEKFYKKNSEVYKGYVNKLQGNEDTSTKYCLYELFGEDLHWYRYLGEATYGPKLVDHLYSAWSEDRVDQIELFDDILGYESTNYLSCRVYKNRPAVLTQENLDNGYNDPRVLALKTGVFSGYKFKLATIKMTVAKYSSAIVSFLLGPKLFIAIGKVVDKLESGNFWKAIKPIVMLVVGFAMILFILSLVGKVKQYVIGKGSARETISRFLIGIVALGLIFTALAKPTTLNSIIIRGITIVDELFADTINASVEGDEVIQVSKADTAELQLSAAIWKVCIFEPWCEGQFGAKYEKLYTMYAPDDELDSSKEEKRMIRSHQEVDPDDTTGKAFYNSIKYTGDVKVPIGGGREVRNWGAYLYSCGTKYHIDFELDDNASEINTSADVVFPTAQTTAYDSSIMADTFRIIDNQMDIAPQEYATDKLVINNYVKAKPLTNDFMFASTKMLINAALLLFFIPVIASKFKNFILMIIIAVQVIYHSIVELFKEDSGLKEIGSVFKTAFFNYFIACIKANIMVLLYMKFVGQGFVRMIIYCILCCVILSLSLNDLKQLKIQAQHKIRKIRAKR